MTGRTAGDARRWTEEGTAVFLDAVDALSTADYTAPVGLPGWTRQHLIAHVASNAEALGNLVVWAATGVETPMYADSAGRAAGIERGTRLSGVELRNWVRKSAAELEEAAGSLTPEQWSRNVVTAQGRTVPATDVPWLRAREVWVHAVDLDQDVTFDDLPSDFLLALEADVKAKRGDVPDVKGPLAQRVAWLTGRPHLLSNAPSIGPWL